MIMFDDIPWSAIQLQENKAALREYGWWPVGRLQFTDKKRQEHALLDEKIWVICLYQAMQSPMIAWGLRPSNVISQEGFKVWGNRYSKTLNTRDKTEIDTKDTHTKKQHTVTIHNIDDRE